ncbi:unnamed protein product [Medioppia subpectinata]|uniref:Uncharacterized protein n=1 Tax=Medioppia subpectinata TaxID=1979941 RepID=A0A7R9L7I8_9ACAR|nr:unnamed protein product [Medioppia subpectinata]CAG2115688.1 unnamed protein product [Medioppia subpectinata]
MALQSVCLSLVSESVAVIVTKYTFVSIHTLREKISTEEIMELIASKIIRYLAVIAVALMAGKTFARSDTASTKPTTYSPYSSLMYSPYSSMMSSMYSPYSPSMAASMVMPYYSSAYPYAPSAAAATGYGHSSSYHPSQYMMAASYPHSAYVPMPYGYGGYSSGAGGYGSGGYGSAYSPVSSYYG